MKELKTLLIEEKNRIIEKCREFEPSFCAAACPFGLDVVKFMDKIRLKNFTAAYGMYKDATGFPSIAAALCHQPCREVCVRGQRGGAISMGLLEEAAIAFAKDRAPRAYNLPGKDKQIAIVGAGISGLTCGLKLAEKKYKVVIFEQTDKIGGQIGRYMAEEAFLQEIELQTRHESWRLSTNEKITSLAQLEEFDAIYIATGKGGDTLGLSIGDLTGNFCSDRAGVFMGGELLCDNAAEAMSHGIRVALYIESYIKTANMNFRDNRPKSRIPKEPFGQLPLVLGKPPKNKEGYTEVEAIEEAERCFRCRCEACAKNCHMMRFFRKMPGRISDDASATAGDDGIRGEIKVATKLIASCNQCGLCKDNCCENIDMEDFLLKARVALHNKNSLPWKYNDFFLRDMEDAHGPASLAVIEPEGEKARWLFVPGCQLGASDPDYVLKSYEYLRGQEPNTAVTTRCCGAPAIWAGNERLHLQVLGDLRRQWEELGRPLLIFACASCKKQLARYAPEMEGIFLYTLLAERGADLQKDMGAESYAVFDPCSSHHLPTLQEAVRTLAARGCTLKSLPQDRDEGGCCGYGGHTSVANPECTRELTREQAAQSEDTYVTYCVNCRDLFAAEGKRAIHILDAVFDLNDADRHPPGISQRRRNRMDLKRRLLKEYKGEVLAVLDMTEEMNLRIDKDLKRKLNDELILEDCLAQVIAHCEKTGRKMYDRESQVFIGYLQVGYVTYWAHYKKEETGFQLVNAYCHRVKIEGAGEAR